MVNVLFMHYSKLTTLGKAFLMFRCVGWQGPHG
uniref:Uncharacterized protein n=1 Tax=Anguilla anguilla TaxID=7936 RepID=A0A0E9QHB4_ANGAN